MKVYLLDPVKPSARTERLPRFLELGIELHGWDVSRPDEFVFGMDGPEWLTLLQQGIGSADIYVSLGNFSAMEQAGSNLDALLSIMRQKVSSGCPAVFDGCRSLCRDSNSDAEQKIRSWLDEFGVHLTATKVASTIPEYAHHSSNLCCGFHKEDDAFSDPRMFEKVDTVWAYGSSLIQYEPEVFPLIEASKLHCFVDLGDLRTVGNLGQRNAVAVKREREGEYLTVHTGRLLNDRVETLGGTIPGLEDNRIYAERLLSELTSHVRKPTDFPGQSYVLFSELEVRLGDLISKVLKKVSPDGQFVSLLPLEIQAKLRGETGVPDYSRAMYVDLVNIVKKLWSLFEPYFVDDQGRSLSRSSVTNPLSSLNTQRIYLAHPHKARQHRREESREDREALSGALAIVRRAYARALP